MYNLIFDCDGVLVDSEHLSCGTWLPVLARYGVEAELAEIETMIGKSDRAVLDHFSAKTGVEFPPEILAERQQEYFRQAEANLETFPSLPQLLTDTGLGAEVVEHRAIGLADHGLDLGDLGLGSVAGQYWQPSAATEVFAIDEDAVAIEDKIVHGPIR